MRNEKGIAILIRLVRLVEREARLLGCDIEREITNIIEELEKVNDRDEIV